MAPTCAAPSPALRSYGYDMLFEYKKMWGQMFWMGVPFEQDPTGECARATVQHTAPLVERGLG